MLPPDPGPLDFVLQPLQDTAWAQAIAEGATLFPWLETIHVLCLTLVFGTIAVVDLRLLGWQSQGRPVGRVEREMVPITWVAFAGALITGALMFASSAVKYAANWHFQVKMALIVLAGINMLVFQLGAYRRIDQWSQDARPPRAARIAGALSLTLWALTIVFARWIGFSE